MRHGLNKTEHRSLNNQCIWLLERAIRNEQPRIPTKYDEEDVAAISLRLPSTLYKLIDDLRIKEHRSLNNQILWLLEKAVQLKKRNRLQ